MRDCLLRGLQAAVVVAGHDRDVITVFQLVVELLWGAVHEHVALTEVDILLGGQVTEGVAFVDAGGEAAIVGDAGLLELDGNTDTRQNVLLERLCARNKMGLGKYSGLYMNIGL